MKATRELLELCHVAEGKYVLDVGCGIGITLCLIAKRYGCRVVGVGISKMMIDWSKERAMREGLGDRVEFRVADVQSLPFEDALFDVVICESVNVFVANKQKAAREYLRVTKPGGYVGLNEATWIKVPPPPEVVDYVSRAFNITDEIPTSEGWKKLLEAARLRDVVARTYSITAISDLIHQIRWLGFENT